MNEASSSEQGTKRRPSSLTRILPSDRVSFDKQLQIAKAFAALYASNGQPVTNDQVGASLSPAMAPSTVAQTNAFFVDIGLLARGDGSVFTPSQSLLDYTKICGWDESEAKKHLAAIVDQAWFWKLLGPRLMLNPMTMTACQGALASECGAEKEHDPKLLLVVRFVEAAGLVRVEGEMVYAQRQAKPKPADHTPPVHPQQPPAIPGNTEFVLPLAEGKTVKISAPFNLTGQEVARIKAWIDVTLNSEWKPDGK